MSATRRTAERARTVVNEGIERPRTTFEVDMQVGWLAIRRIQAPAVEFTQTEDPVYESIQLEQYRTSARKDKMNILE